MDKNKKVWAPSVEHGFVLGKITNFGSDEITVQPDNGDTAVTVSYDAVYPSEEEGSPAVPDNCGLMYLNEGTMLHNLEKRYMKDQIYTYTANILLALNPYKSLPFYTAKEVAAYQGKSLGVLPPHTYAIADKAYRDMRNLSTSQSVMCSGESGAGKTESTKHLLRYLTDSYGGGGTEDLEQRILAANPFLESFGNAKTTRNNNSSRFGKYCEIHFNRNHLVIGAFIVHYLLEKSRVIEQSAVERNYQVFYRMLRGGQESMLKQLNLSSDASQYEVLKHGHLGEIKWLDDKVDFLEMDKGMSDCGLDSKEKANVYRITAAVMHIGNIKFEDSGDGSAVTGGTMATLSGVAAMLGLDATGLQTALTQKSINIGGQTSQKALMTIDANRGRNALCKSLYSKLFDWIVERINECFPYPKDKSVNFIGILDIAGFEYFEHNSFEQFCINYCNEKLQQFFNERTLKDEQELYVRESIKFKEVEFVDNQDTIDMIEAPRTGLLAILDEQSKVPRATDATFCEKLHQVYAKHFRLQLPRKSKMAAHKKLRDTEGFLIRHFAGAVCYESEGFMEKNNDALSPDCMDMLRASKDPFLVELYKKRPGEPEIKRGKLTLISLGDKFKKALGTLMEKLQSTRATFIRCIKPNQSMKPQIFEGGQILSQLQCAGMCSVLDLMQGGYPSRTAFQDLYDMYKAVLPPELAALEPRTFAKALFKALGLNEADFQFGVSKVFFRPGKFAEFDTIMKADPESLVELVGKVLQWLLKCRWKRIGWASVSSIIFMRKIVARGKAATIMQNQIKMYNARRWHKPRYLGIKELKKVTDEILGMKKYIEKLPKNKEKFLAEVERILGCLKANIAKVRADDHIDREDIKKMDTAIKADIKQTLAEVQKEIEKQKLAEEAERLRKLAEEQEKRRLAEIAAEEARKEAEKQAQFQKEMAEIQRKEAEEAAVKAEAEAKVQAEKKKQSNYKAERQAEMQAAAELEQERRDEELAMRLAMDAGSQGMDADAQASASAGGARRKQARATSRKAGRAGRKNKRMDMSKWKYADLRDTINTSTDVDILEACREEFHRRLKVYHAWKVKQPGGAGGGMVANAMGRGAAPVPQQKLQSAAMQRGAAPVPQRTAGGGQRQQRYFRVPFGGENGGRKGWWYAHFDGQWIARQMELHPERAPVLLMAGKDDMEMCEHSLDATGLAKKRGAEILAREFEVDWAKTGGPQWVPK